MEEDIKILENLLEEGFEAMCYLEAQAIEHLIKAYKELEEENKRLKPKIDVCNWQEKSCREIIDEKYVPVSLIKEKIEELKQEYKIALEENSIKAFILKCQIQALQELLEKRK